MGGHLAHATVGSNRLDEAKAFYDAQFDRRSEVDAFHAKALTLGGTDEGAPGGRGPGWYFSYFRDLDGNKLCAFCTGKD